MIYFTGRQQKIDFKYNYFFKSLGKICHLNPFKIFRVIKRGVREGLTNNLFLFVFLFQQS